MPDERPWECWLVAVPGIPSEDEAFKHLRDTVSKFRGCSSTKFHVPHLKGSDFDHLIKATEEVPKLETECELLLGRLGINLMTVSEKQSLEPSDLTAEGVSIKDYILTYKWDHAKYPVSQSINHIFSLILKQCKRADASRELKFRKYQAVQDQLVRCEKRKQGPLTTRNFLGDLVSPEDFIQDSKILKTVLVAVPNQLKDAWYLSYERLHEEIVPRSTRIICEEEDYTLFSLAILSRSENTIRESARKQGFYVREYNTKENETFDFDQESSALYSERSRLQIPLVSMLLSEFSEIYIAYIHLIAIKIHVESFLRFGPDANYVAAVLILEDSQVKKVRAALQRTYSCLDETDKPVKGSPKQKMSYDPGLMDSGGEYYPYVYSKVKTAQHDLVK